MSVGACYMREHSSVIRVLNPSLLDLETDDILEVPPGPGRTLARLLCRWRQRNQQRAFDDWVVGTNSPQHDLTNDLLVVLQRRLPLHELRSELEVEVIFKWASRCQSSDPSGVSTVIRNCRSREARVRLIQDMRLESFGAKDLILLQGDVARPGDGHLTVVAGQCELLKAPGKSRHLQSLRQSILHRNWSLSQRLVLSLPCVAVIMPGGGFGELTSSFGLEWPVSVCAHRRETGLTRVIFVSREPLLACLKKSAGRSMGAAFDCLRASGFARLWELSDMISTAQHMRLEHIPQYHLLHRWGQIAKKLSVVISGEIVADTGETVETLERDPFEKSLSSECYIVTTGYLLGDDAFVGEKGNYNSTCATIKSAVLYQIDLPGAVMVAEALRISRDAALINRDRLRFSSTDIRETEINPYSSIDSLRSAVALRNQFRGISRYIWKRHSGISSETSRPIVLSKKSQSRLKSLYSDLLKAKKDTLQIIAQVLL